jgi:uncharacterized DUF497 family protein
MKFNWDEQKNRVNSAKHGIDFETATQLWNDGGRIEIHTSFPDEKRSIMIGRIERKLWAAVFTPRGGAIRIISVRRARRKEVALYENEKSS